MFTGLVETIGEIRAIYRRGSVWDMEVLASFAEELSPGQSVAVSGACLTVVDRGRDRFVVEITDETWKVARFHQVRPGAKVNLERAMVLGGRLDGHLVTGHVDCVGTVISLQRGASDGLLWVSLPEDHFRYVVQKGSVCVDGISLTVAELGQSAFSVAVIPETLKATTLGVCRQGDLVNLETDIIGKYVERLLGFAPSEEIQQEGPLTLEKLRELGW